jgi:hypothetical protein
MSDYVEKTLETILQNSIMLKKNDDIIWKHLKPAIEDIGNIAEITHTLLKENKELKAQLAMIHDLLKNL